MLLSLFWVALAWLPLVIAARLTFEALDLAPAVRYAILVPLVLLMYLSASLIFRRDCGRASP